MQTKQLESQLRRDLQTFRKKLRMASKSKDIYSICVWWGEKLEHLRLNPLLDAYITLKSCLPLSTQRDPLSSLLARTSTSTSSERRVRTQLTSRSGVGFGICRRLLCNIAQSNPEDARPLFPLSGTTTDATDIAYPCEGLTLIMACRNRQRAEVARTQLLEQFEEDVASLREERVAAFRKNLVVAIHLLDLASVRSTLAFADEIVHT